MNYLAAQTVKSLHSVAKTMGLTGYSKLRKAELVAFLTERINGWHVIALDMDRANYAAPVKILDVTEVADQPEIVKIMASVTPVTFSATPVKAPESAPKATEAVEAEETTTEDLIFAYRQMRATFRKARGITQIKIGNRLRNLSAMLRAREVYMREV